eukprot:8046569-Ditylum_brightwellii.AAC.1
MALNNTPVSTGSSVTSCLSSSFLIPPSLDATDQDIMKLHLDTSSSLSWLGISPLNKVLSSESDARKIDKLSEPLELSELLHFGRHSNGFEKCLLDETKSKDWYTGTMQNESEHTSMQIVRSAAAAFVSAISTMESSLLRVQVNQCCTVLLRVSESSAALSNCGL